MFIILVTTILPFSLKCKTHDIKSDVITTCFKIPENNYENGPNVSDIANMHKSETWKFKSNNPISGVSQKALVVKSATT